MADDGSPTLEVGFAIDTGGSFSELAQLQQAMDSTEAKVLADAANIERATGGMLNLGGATAQITSFGAASTQAGATSAAAIARAEKAGESLSRQMERQISTFGMSRTAAAALRAEQNGLTELAGRLRDQEATLVAMRGKSAAAMRDEAAATRAFSTTGAVSMAAGASAATGLAGGMAGLGRSTQAAQIEMLEMTHIARNLTEQIATGVNPFRALTMESGRLMTAIQYGGAGIGGFVKQFAGMLGIIKTVQNAELAEAAASTAASAAAIRGFAERAQAGMATAAVEIELAQAAQRVATTDVEAAAAADSLAAAYEAQSVAATQLTIAQEALVGAEAGAAEAAAASEAATVTMIGATTAVLAPFIVAAGVAFGAFKMFQSQVKDSGELTRYRDSLGLTHKQMLQLSDGVDKAGGKIKELTGVTITAGDMMAGLWQTIKDGASGSAGAGAWEKIKGYASDAFGYVLKAWNITSAGITAGIYGTFNAVKIIWNNFPAVFGDLFVQAVNAAIGALNVLVKHGTDLLNDFIHAANKIPGVNVGDVTAPQIGLMDNPNAGAATKAAAAIGDAYKKAYADAKKSDADFWHQVGENAKQHAKDRMKAEADALKANATPKRAKTDPNIKAEAELQAAIKGQWALAAAYQVSDAAAMKAEALQKAEEDAIKHKGETGVYYELELQKAVATTAAEGAKHIADLRAQAAAQKEVNDAVAAGTLPASQMSQALQAMTEKRQLLAAISVAAQQGDLAAWIKLNAELQNLTKTQADANAEANRAQVLASTGAGQDQIAQLQLQLSLIGATNKERAVAIAQLQAEQFLAAHPLADAAAARAYIEGQKQIAALTDDLTTGNDKFNKSLSYTADLLGLIHDRTQTIASALSDAFGNIGSGLGQAMTAMSTYAAQQAKLDQDHNAAVRAGLSDEKELNLYRQASLNNQVAGTAQMIGGLKTMFAEHSAGYQAMTAAEEAFAVIQAVNTIKSVAAGAAKMFSQLGIFAFPVVAAMVAVMAGFGFRGSSTQAAPTSSADLQKAAGTGTVLGSPNDKSASIANSLSLVAKNTAGDLQYSSQMLSSLKSIDASIGAMAATVAKQINVSGSLFDTTKLNIGSSGSAGFLGLFSSSTTRTLYDAGITLAATTVGKIITSGIAGQTYQIVQQVKKSSGFLGIGGGTKTSYQTTTGALPSDITASIQSVIGALENGIVTAAGSIGISGAKAMLDNFNVNIGKLSFNGLDAQGIEDQLNAIFSSVGDQMTAAVLPGIAKFQKVGEGLFETLERVASTVVSVDAEFKKLGQTSTTMGIDVDMGVASMFDSVSDFTSAADAYFQTYYSTAEQTAAQTAELQQVFASLNLTMPDSLAAFRSMVEAQDLTTTAGQQTYATLLKIAPAFADLQQALNGAKSAADVLSERQNLLNQLWQLQGNTAAIRAAQLASLDASNRDLQEQIYALQDAQDAAKAAQDLADAWKSAGSSILDEINRIRGLSDSTGATSFASALGQFNAATTAARGGDQTAAQSLPQLSQALLTAAEAAATSRQELDRIQAQTAASLEATYGMISGLSGTAAPASTTDLLSAAGASQAAAASANDNTTNALSAKLDALLNEIEQLRSDNNAGHATTAGNTGSIKRSLDNVTAQGGGMAISTTAAAA